MNLLPPHLTEEKYKRALDFAKLASRAYDSDDKLVAQLGMLCFSGIDDIRRQSFETPKYREVGSGGNWIDWWGGRDNGLDYTVFENKETKDQVIAFRGTEPLSMEDWLHDAKQVVKVLGKPEQYQAAVKLAWDKVTELEGTGIELSFTGHSLGGGLATAAALATGKEAIVFDAAGISNNSLQDPLLGLDLNNASKITNFNVRNCFVSDWNHLMDETTLGTDRRLDIVSKQFGEIFWLESISDRANFLLPDSWWIVRKAETFLAHAWHVFTYQLEQKKFHNPLVSRL